MKRNHRQQAIINALALVAILACGYITVTDSMMTVFGQSQGVQYLFNIIYMVAVLPTAIAVSDLFERLHPELSEENETNA